MQGLVQAVFSKGGELLTWIEDIVERWKEHFEELLNLTNMSSMGVCLSCVHVFCPPSGSPLVSNSVCDFHGQDLKVQLGG